MTSLETIGNSLTKLQEVNRETGAALTKMQRGETDEAVLNVISAIDILGTMLLEIFQEEIDKRRK